MGNPSFAPLDLKTGPDLRGLRLGVIPVFSISSFLSEDWPRSEGIETYLFTKFRTLELVSEDWPRSEGIET